MGAAPRVRRGGAGCHGAAAAVNHGRFGSQWYVIARVSIHQQTCVTICMLVYIHIVMRCSHANANRFSLDNVKRGLSGHLKSPSPPPPARAHNNQPAIVCVCVCVCTINPEYDSNHLIMRKHSGEKLSAAIQVVAVWSHRPTGQASKTTTLTGAPSAARTHGGGGMCAPGNPGWVVFWVAGSE